jgi:hypothetical protein
MLAGPSIAMDGRVLEAGFAENSGGFSQNGVANGPVMV